jgi:type II secretory pathway pseudopilin PulG
MIRRESGFTLIELIITILMSILIIAAAASAFLGLLGQSGTQSKIVESNENMVGLEILRRDVESAGYGLFWSWNTAQLGYQEAVPDANNPYASGFNYGDVGTNVPRAIVSQNNAVYAGVNNTFSGSDYLVIKSMNVARNITGEKWTYVTTQIATVANIWTSTTAINDNFQSNPTPDRVIALEIRDPTTRALVTGASYYTTYIGGNPPLADANFIPADPNDAYVIYGLDNLVGGPRSPFNRADYFISATGPDGVPSRCAPNTGVLYKATLNQTDGSFSLQSLLDCVADMQVGYWLDTDGTGNLTASTDISGLTAQQVRTELKQVGIYILTHEGRKDLSYTYPTNPIYVGDPVALNGRPYALGANLNYLWHVYQLIMKPTNLGS